MGGATALRRVMQACARQSPQGCSRARGLCTGRCQTTSSQQAMKACITAVCLGLHSNICQPTNCRLGQDPTTGELSCNSLESNFFES